MPGVAEAAASECLYAIRVYTTFDEVRASTFVDKGDGRFEPREGKIGHRGDGYVEVLDGVDNGEEVVTSATFLIDAESNLKAALQAFTRPETSK